MAEEKKTTKEMKKNDNVSKAEASSVSNGVESKVYNQDGKEVGKVTLPEEVFGLPWNADLVHQVVVGMQANARTPVAHAHDRGEQSGGGRKPWRQKGTGRARHGSRRSPIWRGGGVTHGPRNEKNYSKKVNAKMRAKALYTVLSRKLKDGEIVFVDAFAMSEPKTKAAASFMSALGGVKDFEKLTQKEKNAAFVAFSTKDENAVKSFRNLPQVGLGNVQSLNPVEVLSYKYLIIENPEEAVQTLSAKRAVAKKPATQPTGKAKAKAEKKEVKRTPVTK